jgi:ribosomal protein S18 acetylase RimI-like enzyme
MPVVTATPADLPAVKAFVHSATRRQGGAGDEDLAMLVEGGNVLLATTNRDRPLAPSLPTLQRRGLDALAAFYPEPRPESLPSGEPDRVFLRTAAFRNGISPSAALHELLDVWCRLPAQAQRLLIAYGGEPWYNRSLLAAECTLAEEVIFLALPHLDRHFGSASHEAPVESAGSTPQGAAFIRPAQAPEIDTLAELDAACFNVLWHMGRADLRQLLLFGRLSVAVVDGELAGYLALTIRGEVAQIARLAVHGRWSGHGIGRQLLVEGLRSAVDAGCTSAILNTQAQNLRAQGLYRSLRFYPTGERFEVYTRWSTAEV